MSYRLSTLLLCSGVAILSTPVHAADVYTFDKSHTEIRFSWDHLGLSRQSGQFRDVDGTLVFNPERPEESHVEVVIKAASLSTGVRELDQALRSREFLDTATNPVMTFRSTEVSASGPRTAAVKGDLTIAGQTRPVVLDVTWNFAGEHPLSKINPAYTDMYYAGFSAKTQIHRSDWGITRTIPYVSDEIQISIETELKRKDAAAAGAVAPPRALATERY